MAHPATHVVFRPRRTRAGAGIKGVCLIGLSLALVLSFAVHGNTLGEPHIVGVTVNDTEVGAVAAYREQGRFWLPLGEIVHALGFEHAADNDNAVVRTSLGAAVIEPKYLTQIDGQTYIRQDAFAAQLATAVAFDSGDYSLNFQPPGPSLQRPAAQPVTPDVLAPSWSVSRLDAEAGYLYRDESDVNFFSAELGGALAGGQWQGRLRRDSLGDAGLEDYVWLRRSDNRVWAVGSRQVALHPLLPAFEFTGAAVSFSPRIDALYDTVSTGSQLSRSNQSAVRDFDGVGPAGGVAELRVDQVVYDRTRIGLDGRYEFRNVALPARGFQQIEVHLYDRSSRTPIRIDDFSQTISQVVLPQGTYFASLGAGVSGNPLSNSLSIQDESLSFMAQARYGLTDSLTGELMVQRDGSQVQFLAGGAYEFAPRWNAAAALAGGEEGNGYHFETNGLGEKWRFRAYAVERSAGLGRDASRLRRRQMDFQWQVTPGFSLGLLGRSEKIDRVNRAFLKPTLAWFAGRNFSLRSYPDADGDYRHDVQYRPADDWRLAWSRADGGNLFDVSHRFDRRWRTRLTHQDGGPLDQRQIASVTRFAANPWGATVEAGISRTDGKLGYFFDALFSVASGIRARFEVRNEPIFTGVDSVPKELTAQLTLFGDFTLAGRRLLPARTGVIASGRGGIAGRLVVNDSSAANWDLEQATILVNGAPRGRVGPGGSFYVDQLREGVHKIRVNEATLPIELQDTQGTLMVEVRGGAVTPVDLNVAAFYGFAGQVTDRSGKPVPGVKLHILNEAGEVVAQSVSDEYGLYRVDGLPSASYTVEAVVTEPGGVSGRHEVEALGAFLFDQNVVLNRAPTLNQ